MRRQLALTSTAWRGARGPLPTPTQGSSRMIAGTDYLGKDVLAAVQPAERRGAMSGEDEILQLWDHVYGGQRGTLATFSGSRPTVGDTKLEEVRSGFFRYPDEGPEASDWLRREALAGREVYFCAHLLTAPRRTKDNAALLAALYADGDGASIGAGTPTPTAVVESSSRRTQLYWALTEPVVPEFGEHLNHRLALA